jgi:spore coat protein CotH
MKEILLVVIFLVCCEATTFSQNTSDSVRINIALLDTPKANKVSIVVEVKNLSDKLKKVLKHGRVDYVNGQIKPVGNYIVEVERFEKGGYIPFLPTADIDPAFENEHWEIKPSGYVKETVNLEGRSWNSKGFPKGQYRVRIAFNWDEWSSSLKNTSKWTMFSIE